MEDQEDARSASVGEWQLGGPGWREALRRDCGIKGPSTPAFGSRNRLSSPYLSRDFFLLELHSDALGETETGMNADKVQGSDDMTSHRRLSVPRAPAEPVEAAEPATER